LTGGFVGKFYVFGAAVQHQYFWLVGIAVVNVGIGAYYYLNIVRTMFFAPPEEPVIGPMRLAVPVSIQVIVFLCVVATIWLGFYPPNVIEWANEASRQLLALML
jgi:NADH-quinone oxidoreductase subunit N